MAKGGGKGSDKAKAVAGEGRIASNRRARHDYEILGTFEAGIALVGPEVKSLRAGRANLTDAWAHVRGGEAWLHNLQIDPYEQAGRANLEPKRERKLLLHRHEIARLAGRVTERGFTLVPLSLYWKAGRAKVELAIVRGKKRHDKRQAIRNREEARDMDRAVRRGRSR